jgi:hypothetical protein
LGRINRGLKPMMVFIHPEAVARIRSLGPKIIVAEFIREAIDEKLERLEPKTQAPQ